MKIINAEIDFIIYNRIFRYLKANHYPVVVWQNLNGHRAVSDSFLNSYHHESKLLHFDHHPGIHFDPKYPIYCYSEDAQLIFKTVVHELADNYISLKMPKEIKVMAEMEQDAIQVNTGINISTVWRVKRLNVEQLDDGPDYIRVKSMAQRSNRDKDFLTNEFQGSLDEEDKLYADKRESPRARPKKDKFVKLKLADNEEVHRLKLFDLSQGGMGFVTQQETSFPKGSILHVLGFDNFDLDDPLVGKVMSQRLIEEGKPDWKIGVKFDEGQS